MKRILVLGLVALFNFINVLPAHALYTNKAINNYTTAIGTESRMSIANRITNSKEYYLCGIERSGYGGIAWEATEYPNDGQFVPFVHCVDGNGNTTYTKYFTDISIPARIRAIFNYYSV